VRLLLAPGPVIPFVEAIDGHDARPLGEGAAERRLRCDGLGACVEEPVRNRRVLRPTGQESPPVTVEDTLAAVLGHGEEPPLGTDVPTGVTFGFDAGRKGGLKEAGQARGWSEESDSTAHGISSRH
jgi:hypothetical protein